MLLANISVAKRIYRAFPDRALLRRHPKPDAKLLDDVVIVYNYNAFCHFSSVCPIEAKISGCQEIKLDVTNSKTLQVRLTYYRRNERF